MAVGAALVMIARVDPVALNPSPRALGWSAVPLVAVLAVLVGALPAWIAPPVPRPAVRRRARPDEPTATAASAGPSGLTTAGTP
jgi:energy-coupling factor transport system permease protein